MVSIPALLLAQPDEPFTGSEAEPGASSSESGSFDAEIGRLGAALEGLGHSPTSSELRSIQKLAHDVMTKAEQRGFGEVANAIFHIEDTLTAFVDGELEPSEGTRRQINAAFRAARAACALQPVEASNTDAAGLRGSLLLVLKDPQLTHDITRAAARRKFLAAAAAGPDEARDIAGAAAFSGLIMDFDADSVEQSQALAMALRELPGTRRCPLVVIADSP
ncbi:MAG TPA: hypothetical protein VNW92_17820, partial [Polyangiaceae bacterium]|nr:hypothetical protein [Polyangiaceae bacterium]